ncbi:hypothetical protein MOX02_15620 [Methylobacterium oxalidis]|uniref:Uncharacterized protein n=1 Tax=Methylobacterium oxalidis TaxID=944322 RepID=A0A512J0P5_9HYPH|nr:hypothetical protein MOX02_15620 [Methylobacterium oxalidis]GLS66556.1 hypothetical protein GCM10007888_49390 [Methylobacterium oxalidis]
MREGRLELAEKATTRGRDTGLRLRSSVRRPGRPGCGLARAGAGPSGSYGNLTPGLQGADRDGMSQSGKAARFSSGIRNTRPCACPGQVHPPQGRFRPRRLHQ